MGHRARWIGLRRQKLSENPNPNIMKLLAARKEQIVAYKAGTASPVSHKKIPVQLVAFSDQVNRELHDAIRRALNTIRWRLGHRGRHNPVRATQGVRWLAEDREWYPLPTS